MIKPQLVSQTYFRYTKHQPSDLSLQSGFTDIHQKYETPAITAKLIFQSYRHTADIWNTRPELTLTSHTKYANSSHQIRAYNRVSWTHTWYRRHRISQLTCKSSNEFPRVTSSIFPKLAACVLYGRCGGNVETQYRVGLGQVKAAIFFLKISTARPVIGSIKGEVRQGLGLLWFANPSSSMSFTSRWLLNPTASSSHSES